LVGAEVDSVVVARVMTSHEAKQKYLSYANNYDKTALVRDKYDRWAAQKITDWAKTYEIPVVFHKNEKNSLRPVWGNDAVHCMKVMETFFNEVSTRFSIEDLYPLVVRTWKETISKLSQLPKQNYNEDQEKLFCKASFDALVRVASFSANQDLKHLAEYTDTATLLGWEL
jgi:hypothetical protein